MAAMDQLVKLMQLQKMMDDSDYRRKKYAYDMGQDEITNKYNSEMLDLTRALREQQTNKAKADLARTKGLDEFRSNNAAYLSGLIADNAPVVTGPDGKPMQVPDARQEFMTDYGQLLSEETGVIPKDALKTGQDLYDNTYGAAASESSKNYGGVRQYVGRNDKGEGIIWNPQEGKFEIQQIPTTGVIKPKTDKDLPDAEIDFLEKAGTLNNQIDFIDKQMAAGDEWKSWVGPYDARVGRIQDVSGVGANKDRAVFQSTIQDIQNMMIYMRSGKQINESEYERIVKAMPDVNDSEKVFPAKWARFKQVMKDVMDSREKRLKDQPGYGNSLGTSNPSTLSNLSTEDLLNQL